MANKSITQQIAECKNQLEQAEKEREQLTHQVDKIKSRNRQAEHKARTRRLIEKGAILESINPSFVSLSGEQLQAYLQAVLQTNTATKLLQEMTKDAETQ